MTATLGDQVIYRVHAEHVVKHLARGDDGAPEVGEDGKPTGRVSHHGSVHHHAMTEFVGHVCRAHGDGTYDVALMVPNRAELQWVDKVKEGTGDHEFVVRREKRPPAPRE